MRAVVSVRSDVRVRSLLRLRTVVRSRVDTAGLMEAHELLPRLMHQRERVLGFLRRRLSVAADAEDLFQQALVRATEHAHTLEDPERASAWFFAIARRVLADHHGSQARERAKVDALASELATDDGRLGEDGASTCGCALRRLNRIRSEYAEILQRVTVGEEPIAEVAAELGITANNAAVRLHRAHTALRAEVQALCGTVEPRACRSCACGG